MLRGVLFFSPPVALRLLLALPPLLAAWARLDFEDEGEEDLDILGEAEVEELRDAIACSLECGWGRCTGRRGLGSIQAGGARTPVWPWPRAGNALPTRNLSSAPKPAVGRTERAT